MHPAVLRNEARCSRQQGYTLVEIMVAILIALFLLGGLATVVQDNRRTATNQTRLAQLQDQQRLAMSVLSNVIQSAGYFPDPTSNSPGTMFPSDANFAATGQYLSGVNDWNAAAPGDTIRVRYATVPGDGILLCNGGPNPGAAGGPPTTFTNTLSIKPDPSDNNRNALTCNLASAAGNQDTFLVGGIRNLQIRYGVHRNGTRNSVDTYVDTSKMSAADWANVISVKVALTFDNPLYVTGQAATYQTITFTRVISVMANTGVTTL